MYGIKKAEKKKGQGSKEAGEDLFNDEDEYTYKGTRKDEEDDEDDAPGEQRPPLSELAKPPVSGIRKS